MSQQPCEGTSRFSLHQVLWICMGWALQITPVLILTHCSCLFSSFHLPTWTLEIMLVKRQWRLWVLCLLSLKHPATPAHFPCPAPTSWETNKQKGMVWNSLRNASQSVPAIWRSQIGVLRDCSGATNGNRCVFSISTPEPFKAIHYK